MSNPRDRRDPRFTSDKTVIYPGGFPPASPLPTSQPPNAQPQERPRQAAPTLEPNSGQEDRESIHSPVPTPGQPHYQALSPQGVPVNFPARGSGNPPSMSGQSNQPPVGRGGRNVDELMSGVGHTVYEFSGHGSDSASGPERASMKGSNQRSVPQQDQTFYSDGSFAIPVEDRPHDSNLKSGGAWKLFVPVVLLTVVGGLGWALMHDREEQGPLPTQASEVSKSDSPSNADQQPPLPETEAIGKKNTHDVNPSSEVGNKNPINGGSKESNFKSNQKPGQQTGTSTKKTDTAKPSVSTSNKKKTSKKPKTSSKSKSKSIKPKSGPRPKRPPKKSGLDDLPVPD